MTRFFGSRRALFVNPIPRTYFGLGGITDPTEIAATTTLIAGLQADGTYTLFDRLWLMSPTSLVAASYCVISLKQLTFINSPGFSSTGVHFDGASSYALTPELMNDSVNLPQYNASQLTGHTGFYATTIGALSGTKYLYGSQGVDSGDNATLDCVRQQSTAIVNVMNSSSGASQSATTLTASHQLNDRIASNNLKRYRNGAQASSLVTSPGSTHPNAKMGLGCLVNTVSTPSLYMDCTCAMFHIGGPLSAAQQLTVYNRIQTFQTSLGRNV